MSVTMKPPRRTGPKAWRLRWSSTESDPTYRVFRDGVLVLTTPLEQMTATVEAGETPVFEVFDDTTSQPQAAFGGRLTLAWYGAAAVDHYRVEEYVGAAWTLRDKIRDTGHGSGWQVRWTTRWLEDATTHQFRIVAIGDNGNATTVSTWSAVMVRHPNPPVVGFSYDSGTGKVTLSAA